MAEQYWSDDGIHWKDVAKAMRESSLAQAVVLEQATMEINSLRQALARYGGHEEGCPARLDDAELNCHCGWSRTGLLSVDQ